MKKTVVCQLLGVEYPIVQAGIPWISNPELVAAVSEAGGLGSLHPTAGMDVSANVLDNLVSNVKRVQQATRRPFAMSFDLGDPDIQAILSTAVEAGVRIAITYGGSPALHTGYLRDHDVIVMHQVASVRHARAAEAQGVQAVIAEGFEGGGPRGRDAVPSLVLVPSIADAVSIPVLASGGIIDQRGFAAALVLGAGGVQMGTRFVVTRECIAHSEYKKAIIMAIDTGTVVAGTSQIPTRLLRTGAALKFRRSEGDNDTDGSLWRSMLGPDVVRAALLQGDMKEGIAWSGAGVGLISEEISAAEVIEKTVKGAEALLASLAAP